MAFKCVMTDVASASYASDTQILECEATPSINEGTFVVEDASVTDTTDRVVIPEDGLYELIVSLYVDNGTGTRTTPHVSFTVETGGVVTILDDEGTGYIRGSQGGQDEGAIDHTSIVELLADDRIGLVVRQEGTPNITIEGAKSFLAIVKAGGAVGAVGPTGPAGADGTGQGDITAVTTAATSGLAGGATSGDVALRLHINGLTDTTITGPDQIAYADASDSHTSKRTTQAGLGTHMAGSGLDVSATGQLGIDINELPALSNLAGADLVGVSDADDSHTDKRASLAALAAHLAGTNLTADSDGVLSASGGGGGGTDDQTAAEVPVTATGFTGNLGSADDDVQAALDTIDDFDLEDTFKGAWSAGTYRGGQMVVLAGLEYISLIDGNTREPTRSEEQWSAQPRGYIYRGDAPVAATTYQESHIVRVPAQDSWYICTFQGGVSVTRAQIAAGHANFAPFAHRLTDAQVSNGASGEQGTISGSQLDDFAPELGIAEATSKVSDEFGRVSGRRIGEAIDAHIVPSTNATTDISTASAIGTSVEYSRDDHEHSLPIDNTLEFNSSDELAVNVQDVIEHLQERIQYHTNSGNYSSPTLAQPLGKPMRLANIARPSPRLKSS